MPNQYLMTHRPLKAFFYLCFVIVLLSGFLALQPHPAYAATFTVNSLSDTGGTCPTPTTCTLRQAITDANTAGGSNTITFSVTGTIILTSTLPTITSNITISGPGAGLLAIDGASTNKIMNVNSGATLNLSGVTLQNGKSASLGGAINNGGTLMVTNSTFANNSAVLGGAINNGGTVTITSSTFSNNSVGGGIGGAINTGGTVTITSSTFSNNSAAGGIGGAINAGGTLMVTNSTFANNSAGIGGAINNGGTLTMTNSTFSANSASFIGGAINTGGTVTMTNSIVANSTSGGNCNGTLTVSGANMADDGTCSGFNAVTTAQLNLGSLANNGGSTQTIALGAGSVAIDAAPSCSVTTDQRGFVRPAGAACDLGAYEFGAVAPTPTPMAVASSAQSPMCSVLGFPNTGLVKAVVPPGIATTGNIPVTICYGILTDPVQIGVLDRPITLAVEVVAYTQTQTPVSVAPLLQPISICLSGSGTLLYRDATGQPRVVTTLNAFSNGGFTCASIPNAGTVILVPGPAAPAGSIPSIAASGPSHALSACSIKTQDIVNLHASADTSSAIITQLPTGTTLYATARADDWIEVIYGNSQGWLAVRYLALDGNCS